MVIVLKTSPFKIRKLSTLNIPIITTKQIRPYKYRQIPTEISMLAFNTLSVNYMSGHVV
jgi:hypothetical protein